MPLGRLGKDKGQLTEPKARAKALAILGAVEDGRDPYAERETQIALAEADAAAKKVKAKTHAFTVGTLIEFWAADREKAGRRPGYLLPAVAAIRRGLSDDLDHPAAA